MRRLALLIATASCAAMAAPVAAQNAPTRTAEDFLCAFAGKCEKSSGADDSIEAPETKGFNLGVGASRASNSGSRAASATTSSRPTTRQPSGQASRPVATGSRVASSRPTRSAVATQSSARRLDLRLSFHLNSADLTPQAREEAKVFAKALMMPELSGKRFLIEGHTDSSGGRSVNMTLSQRRAAAVADFLASQGVARDRFEIRGFGPDRPIKGYRASDPSNRRVEAQLL